MKKAATSRTELYSNQMGSVFQDDAKSALIVQFAGTTETFNVPCFFCLKKAVDSLDLSAMAENLEADIELLTPCGCDRCYILSLTEAYYFQDLLAGAKAMIDLNSILRERLYSYSLV